MSVYTWPAPDGEAPSTDYTVDVNGTPVFVYQARVRAEILRNDGLWTHRADPAGERTAFAIFDMDAPVTVTVRPARPFMTAAVLPARAGVAVEVSDGIIRFTLDRPQHLTVLLDGSDESPLHLFISEPETDAPRPGDLNVVYFGPGVHEVDTLKIAGGQTVYLAGGAIVKAVLRPDEQGVYSDKWKVTFYHGVVFDVSEAENVRICGRGILDGSLVPHPGHSLVRVSRSRNVRLEGIMLRDAPNWNVTIHQSEDVRVDGLRLISGRLNSDGINSINSRDVQIRRCFVRNHDDSIVAKTPEPENPGGQIRVEDCTLWCDWGYALGVTYETRAPIRDVSFHRCNILYARHWCLGVHLSDSATVSDIAFIDTEIADLATAPRLAGAHAALSPSPRLLRLSISRDVWGKDPEAGRIRNVTVDGVDLRGSLPPIELFGSDKEHDIRGVSLRNIRLDGRPVAPEALAVERNDFVYEVSFS